MAPDVAAQVVWGLVGWALLVAVLQFMVIPTANEVFRHKIFELRRELFIYMAEGHISPDEPAYKRLRKLFNQLLRFTERVTFVRMMLIAATYDPSLNDERPIEEVIGSVKDERVRTHLRGFHLRVSGTILVHLVVTSPLAWVLTLGTVVYLVIKRGVSAAAAWRRMFNLTPTPIRIRVRLLEDQAGLLACA